MQLEVPRSSASPVWLSSVHLRAPHAPISQLPWTMPEQAAPLLSQERAPPHRGWGGLLECGPPAVSHKFSGTVSGVPLPETFPPVSHGPSCPGEDGQYNDGVYQPSRGVTLPSVVHAGMQTDPVELQLSPLSESDARPRRRGPASCSTDVLNRDSPE